MVHPEVERAEAAQVVQGRDEAIQFVGRQIVQRLRTAKCMVTAQLDSCADERALECLWSWLRTHKNGILVYEGGSFDSPTDGSFDTQQSFSVEGP